jgi:nitrite reductase/ring-hydroxylating ferredoxin subunit
MIDSNIVAQTTIATSTIQSGDYIMKVPLIKIEDIPDEGTQTVDFFGREVLVMKVEGIPKAVMNACLHLGGPLERQDERMICAWHGAEFACNNGHRLKGPARPETRLMFLPTRIEDGTLIYVYGE